ncbi:hypothetical protein CDO73_15575 [Saccharibacillus sp. O23]|nr:hypothetical protein CDO73_15575 [Saccharibacillus sp. O23]
MPLVEQTISALFQQNFGKLPDNVRVSANEKCLIIRLEGFMGDTVKTMISENSYGALSSTRELIVGYMLAQLGDLLQTEFELSAARFYYDWHDEDLSCIISVILREDEHYALDDTYTHKEEIHDEVAKLTAQVEKIPQKLHSFWVDRDFLVVVRRGLLIDLELALLEDGHQEALRRAKRKVEKRQLAQKSRVSAIVGRKLKGVYLDWAFEADSSMLVYAFESAEENAEASSGASDSAALSD